jgi:hypothetical protein
MGLDGKPRALHIEEALASIAFDRPPVEPHPHPSLDAGPFRVERVEVGTEAVRDEPCGSFRALVVLRGAGEIAGEGGNPVEARAGDTVLLAAAAPAARVSLDPGAVYLRVTAGEVKHPAVPVVG